jgi:nicotinate dehydrogenase subunit A
MIPRAGNSNEAAGRHRRAARTLHSYTNDFARAAKGCQACLGGRLARLYANVILETSLNQARRAIALPDAARMTQAKVGTNIRLHVNGRIHEVDASPDTALLYVLRNDLELNGPKYGCGLGECGTCTVLIDGVSARSCVIPIEGCVDREILTLEGLGTRNAPDPVQEAFITEQAAQCGYCLNGMIMTTKALLLRNPHPTEQEVMEALRYNLCRCGAHLEIIRAVMRAADVVIEAHD